MNFSQRQADPRRHLVGFTFVILLHVLIVYALVTGLAKKVVDVVRAPIETKVIEEIKKPPPPPEIEAPPPPFIPPPEVQIATPPPQQPTISVTTSTPPPAPVTIAPTAPVVVAPPAPPPPRPATMSIGVACTKQVQPSMPVKAIREGITGTVKAEATIKGGKVIEVRILHSFPRGVFDAAVKTAMMQYGCQSGDEEIKAEQTFDF